MVPLEMAQPDSKTGNILVVDDHPQNVQLLADRLLPYGYQVATADNGESALAAIAASPPDLVLLDVVMPGLDGYEVCRRIRANPQTTMLPVVMVTALDSKGERVKGLDAGANDFLGKPISNEELRARVESLLKMKFYYDETVVLKEILEERVEAQGEEIKHLGQLRRFLSPPVAEVIISSGDMACLDSHRREIAVVFCDLRDFTGFSEAVEPEEAMSVLRSYHQALGELVDEYEGTIDHRAGDGLMVFLNDPLPCERPAELAIRLALAMQDKVSELRQSWHRYGRDLGFGVGIAYGYATIGFIGHAGRIDYQASGRPVNLASRLCDEALDGQVLVNERVLAECEHPLVSQTVGEVEIKGLPKPIPVFNIESLASPD